MLILVLADAAAVGLRAADLVADVVTRRRQPVIGLAAGATPLGLYGELVRRHAHGLDLSRLSVFGLDEYLGLPAEHPNSCAWALHRHFIDRVGLAPARVRLLDGMATDPAAEGEAHEQAIAAAGGLDLQILGLGVNGHIGFNEPGSSLAGRTRKVGLSASTRATNRPGFPPDREVPTAAITMGIATILAARRVMLLATGASKAAMVAKAVEGPVTATVPASALQLHPDAVVILDEAAAAGLERRADYAAEAAASLEL